MKPSHATNWWTALTNFFIRFPNSLHKWSTAVNRFFGRTEISGPPPDVIPNIAVGRNQNDPFHLTYDRNLRNLCIGIMKNTFGLHVSVPCSMTSEVMVEFCSLFLLLLIKHTFELPDFGRCKWVKSQDHEIRYHCKAETRVIVKCFFIERTQKIGRVVTLEEN